MAAMRVDARHAERQVHQPGRDPLPRTTLEYHENCEFSIPFPPLVPSLDKPIVATYMTADVEWIKSNEPNLIAPICYRPVPLPVPRVAWRGVTELCEAGVDTNSGQVELDG